MMRNLLFVLLLSLFPSISSAVTVISSLPYDVTVGGEVYELSENLSSTTYGIYVNANDVTIDLKGYTLTWGTGNGDGDHGIYTTWNKSGLTVFSSVGGGGLLHGATTNPVGNHGIYVEELATDLTIHDISITVKSQAGGLSSQQTAGILAKRTTTANIYNVIVDNQASAVANRHSIVASGIAIETDTATSIVIHNCTVKSAHQGIRINGSSTGTDAITIYDNDVEIDQVATNAYAFLLRGGGTSTNTLIGGLEVYGNTVTTSGNGGRGFAVEHIDNFNIHHNTITAGEAETPESVWTNLMRVRYGARKGSISNNTLNVLCGQSGYTSGKAMSFTPQDGLDGGCVLGTELVVTDNIITVDNQDSSRQCIGLSFGNVPSDANMDIHGNSITSNDIAVGFTPDSSSGGYIIADLTLIDTTITKTAPASGVTFYSYLVKDEQGGISTIGFSSNCASYLGGASETDVLEVGGGTFSYSFNECYTGSTQAGTGSFTTGTGSLTTQ